LGREGMVREGDRRKAGREMGGRRNNKCYACTHVSVTFLYIITPYIYLSLLCSIPHLPVLQLPCPGTSYGVMDAFYQNTYDIALPYQDRTVCVQVNACMS